MMNLSRAPCDLSSLSSASVLSSSPSVQSRKQHSSPAAPPSSGIPKAKIACPLPLKVPYSTKTTIQQKSPLQQDGVNDFLLDNRQGEEWEEKNVLFDDIGYSSNHRDHAEDGESFINLIEAEWELEQIFRTAPVAAANPQRLAWMEEDSSTDLLDEEDAQFDTSWIAEDDLPRLGFSPLEMLTREEPASPSVSTPQLFVIPPSRARNPVPLNTPFQVSAVAGRSMAMDRDYLSSPFYADTAINHLNGEAFRVGEGERVECLPANSPISSSPSLTPSSPSSSALGGHMRKRNRSYSDSMLKRDHMGDMTNNLVLVS